MNARVPLVLALLLAVAHLVLGLVEERARPETTYVLTPLVDVWPEGPPLTAEEGRALGRELRHGIDARQISQAYGTLGATLSLAELLAGIQALDGELAPADDQRAELLGILEQAAEGHAELVALQRQILDQEARIAGRVQRVQAMTGVQPRLPGPPPGSPPGSPP